MIEAALAHVVRNRVEAAVFVYVDSGMGTRNELDSWGKAHRRLWEKLRKSGRRIEVVAVAWEQALLDRAGRRLRSWVVGKMSEDEREAPMLRQAIADTDWDTVERQGGFNTVVRKILHWEQENPAQRVADRSTISASAGHAGAVVSRTRLQGRVAHRWCTIVTPTNLLYQRAQPSPQWRGIYLGSLIGRWLARIPRILRGKVQRGAVPRGPRLPRRVVAPHERGRLWRERPLVLGRWYATGQGRSLHSDPCGIYLPLM